jgi:hypothetical protein
VYATDLIEFGVLHYFVQFFVKSSEGLLFYNKNLVAFKEYIKVNFLKCESVTYGSVLASKMTQKFGATGMLSLKLGQVIHTIMHDNPTFGLCRVRFHLFPRKVLAYRVRLKVIDVVSTHYLRFYFNFKKH